MPVGDYYIKEDLIKAKHRYNMLQLAVKGNENMIVEKIAIESERKLYAIDTFKLIEGKYNQDDIFFIMGSDNFRKMPTWKMYENLKSDYKIIVIERERRKTRKEMPKNIMEFIPDKLAEINSTQIRDMIRKGKNVQEYLNTEVYEYIKKNKLYKI